MAVVYPEDPNVWQVIWESKPILVVMFTATWCEPCQGIKPVFNQLAQDPRYQKMKMTFVMFDVDKLQNVTEVQNNVRTIPAFKCFYNREECESMAGNSANALRAMVDTFWRNLQPVGAGGGNGLTGAGASCLSPTTEAMLEMVVAQGLIHILTNSTITQTPGRLAADAMIKCLRNWQKNPSLVPPTLSAKITDSKELERVSRYLRDGLTGFADDLETHSKEGLGDYEIMDYDTYYTSLMHFCTLGGGDDSNSSSSSSYSDKRKGA